jgi:hypothetical protein
LKGGAPKGAAKSAKPIVLSDAVSEDLKKFVGVFQPYAADNDEGVALRKKGFKYADPNGNGLCSVAEIENFILMSLLAAFPKKLKADPDVGRDLFTAFRPVYIRAYNDAKDYKADDGVVLEGTKKATADDFVSKGEFRVFCAQLVVYAMMFDAFAQIDGGGAGRDAGDDRRIEKAEWMKGYKGVCEPYGFVAFKGIANDKAAEGAFKKMDSDGAGMVLLIEWCEFIKAAEVAGKSNMGLILAADEEPSAPSAKGSPPKAKANSFGLCVGKGKFGASDEFFKFAAAFEPLCAETKAGEALRDEGFKAADPNGNGLCSLAELETFVLKSLITKYPKTGKGADRQEPGQDLFRAFRPCYIRSFTDAKDYKADTGAVIKGTKKATDDDFVSKEEFRLFCVYVIVYAAMFDAFSKIDGGGAGRDAGDDKRIELEEFKNGFKGVTGYGFVAFDSLWDAKKKEARELFEQIDDNGGGIVLLDEWCEFIKASEVKAGSAVGLLLAADEAGGTGQNYKLAGKAKVLGKAAKKAATPKAKAEDKMAAGKKGVAIIDHNKWNEGKAPPTLPSQKRAPGRPAGKPLAASGTKAPPSPGKAPIHKNPDWKKESGDAAAHKETPKKKKRASGSGTSF